MKWKLPILLFLICIFLCNINFALAKTSDTFVTISNVPLANVPGTPVLTADSTAQITATWSTNANPAGTEYYIENTTNFTNSGWVTNTSWISAGLSCFTNYSFRVKARNSDLTETNFSSTASIFTQSCPNAEHSGGLLPPQAYDKPTGFFSIVINGGQTSTSSREVVLTLSAGANVTRMSISNDPNFMNSVQEPYQSTKNWTLADGDGVKTVYAFFFTRWGVSSDMISASINYKNAAGMSDQINQLIQKIIDLKNQITGLLFVPEPPPLSPPSVQPPSPTEPPMTLVTIEARPLTVYKNNFITLLYRYINYLLLALLIILLYILWRISRRKKDVEFS